MDIVSACISEFGNERAKLPVSTALTKSFQEIKGEVWGSDFLPDFSLLLI